MLWTLDSMVSCYVPTKTLTYFSQSSVFDYIRHNEIVTSDIRNSQVETNTPNKQLSFSQNQLYCTTLAIKQLLTPSPLSIQKIKMSGVKY